MKFNIQKFVGEITVSVSLAYSVSYYYVHSFDDYYAIQFFVSKCWEFHYVITSPINNNLFTFILYVFITCAFIMRIFMICYYMQIYFH